CTQGALYTLPFRGRRQAFVSTMLLMWWDAVRAAWLYWMGVLRLAVVLVGWSAMFVSLGMKLMARGAVRLAGLPVTASKRVAKQHSRPGVPWIAVVMFRFWCFVEATVFTWVLFPTVSTVVAKFLGPAHARAYTAPALYVFLLVLVRGSFASLRALADAVKTHERKWLAQIVVVGLSVMVFEVLVLYRELVQILASWIAVRTGGGLPLGAWLTVAIPLAGWITVRSMTWFLFGQFGTPTLPARLGHRPAIEPDGRLATAPLTPGGGGGRAELDGLRDGGPPILDGPAPFGSQGAGRSDLTWLPPGEAGRPDEASDDRPSALLPWPPRRHAAGRWLRGRADRGPAPSGQRAVCGIRVGAPGRAHRSGLPAVHGRRTGPVQSARRRPAVELG